MLAAGAVTYTSTDAELGDAFTSRSFTCPAAGTVLSSCNTSPVTVAVGPMASTV